MGERAGVRHADTGDIVQPVVGIVMGSSSDHEIMKGAETILKRFGVPSEIHVVSAHRTPEAMIEYGLSARSRGLRVLIAGAGGAAHLPGMLAAVTTLPVIGVPVALAQLDGLDSLLSIAQMPRGVPVATTAINGATNAGLLAARILSLGDDALANALEHYRQELASQAGEQDRDLPRS
jgi:5-(carboxyamino)imidazole ribonucleotide mutase